MIDFADLGNIASLDPPPPRGGVPRVRQSRSITRRLVLFLFILFLANKSHVKRRDILFVSFSPWYDVMLCAMLCCVGLGVVVDLVQDIHEYMV